MEEGVGSYGLTAEQTPGFFSCPPFTLQFVATSGWVGLLSALVPLRGCRSHLTPWGDVLQPPWESGDLAIFSDLDVWNHPGFAEIIQAPCWLMAFSAWLCPLLVAPGTLGTPVCHMQAQDIQRPHLRFICHPLAITLSHFSCGVELKARVLWGSETPLLCPEKQTTDPGVPGSLQWSGCFQSSSLPAQAGPERGGKPKPQSLSTLI